MPSSLAVFWGVCLPARVALACAARGPKQAALGPLALIISFGFAAVFLGGLRPSGIETGGAPIWWNGLRPLHSLLFFLFFWFSVVSPDPRAWRFLLADACVGASASALRYGFGFSF